MILKKGYDVKALIGLALTFVIITIVLSFGSTITDDLQDSIKEGVSATTVNRTFLQAFTRNVSYALDTRPDCSLSNVYAENATDPGILYVNNVDYNLSACDITWSRAEFDIVVTEGLNLSWTSSYSLEDASYNTTISGMDSLTTFADWLPTLALIVIAAVIIGIIVRYFAFGGA